MNHIQCRTCGVEKELEEFHKDKTRKSGRRDICRSCATLSHRRYYETNRDKLLNRNKESYRKRLENNPDYERNYHLKKSYGLTIADYNNLLASQNFKCAICDSVSPHRKGTDRFFVDHCHESGRVRGLLCSLCNSGLGHFTDNPLSLLRAIAYLGFHFTREGNSIV